VSVLYVRKQGPTQVARTGRGDSSTLVLPLVSK